MPNCGTDFHSTSSQSRRQKHSGFSCFFFYSSSFPLIHRLVYVAQYSIAILFWFVHPEASKVFEHNVVIVIRIVGIFITMTFNRLHFLHCVNAFAVNSACDWGNVFGLNRMDEWKISSNLPGAGCMSLNGTSVTNSPPNVPQLTLTRTEYEITIPMASDGHFPSLIKVDDAKLTSSSFNAPSNAIPEK